MIDGPKDRERLTVQPFQGRDVMTRAESRKWPLVQQLLTEGATVSQLDGWQRPEVGAILLKAKRAGSETEAIYVIEPKPGLPSDVTRIIDMDPYYEERTIKASKIVGATDTKDDNSLGLGMQIDMFAQPQEGVEPDPVINPNDPIFTTSPIVEIRYLKTEY